jgi:hypothetical protein
MEVQRRHVQYSSWILFDCFISVFLCVEYGDLGGRREQQLKKLWLKICSAQLFTQSVKIRKGDGRSEFFKKYFFVLRATEPTISTYNIILISFYTLRNGLIYSIVVQVATPEAVRHEREISIAGR